MRTPSNDHSVNFYPPATTGLPSTAKVLNIFVDDRLVCRIGVNRHDQPVVILSSSAFADIDLREADVVPDDLVDLTSIARIAPKIEDEESAAMPFPLFERTTLVGRAREKEALFDDRDRIRDSDPILTAILDSWVREPGQSKTRTGQISEEIANEFGVKKMAVAGVRAALSRGVYGDFDELVKVRRVQIIKTDQTPQIRTTRKR